jgi:hypothetical protein
MSRSKKVATGIGVLGVLGGVGFYRKNRWRIAEGKLIQSYVNAGTKYDKNRMTRGDVYRHAIGTFKKNAAGVSPLRPKASARKEARQFKKSVKQTIKRL